MAARPRRLVRSTRADRAVVQRALLADQQVRVGCVGQRRRRCSSHSRSTSWVSSSMGRSWPAMASRRSPRSTSSRCRARTAPGRAACTAASDEEHPGLRAGRRGGRRGRWPRRSTVARADARGGPGGSRRSGWRRSRPSFGGPSRTANAARWRGVPRLALQGGQVVDHVVAGDLAEVVVTGGPGQQRGADEAGVGLRGAGMAGAGLRGPPSCRCHAQAATSRAIAGESGELGPSQRAKPDGRSSSTTSIVCQDLQARSMLTLTRQ